MSQSLVLIHGAATTGHVWREVIATIHTRLSHMDIWVPERGCGGSIDDEIALLWGKCRGSIVVGVSGGATLAWELAVRGCPMKAVVAHEPAAGSLVPNLLSYPGQAWSLGGISLREQAEIFGSRLYGRTWNPAELPNDPAKVYRDYLMFSRFEPRKPRIDVDAITLTVGEKSPAVRRRVAEEYAKHFGVASCMVKGAGHCVQLEQPGRFAGLILDAAVA